MLLVGRRAADPQLRDMTRVDPGFEPERRGGVPHHDAAARMPTGQQIRAFVDAAARAARKRCRRHRGRRHDVAAAQRAGLGAQLRRRGAPPPPDEREPRDRVASVTPTTSRRSARASCAAATFVDAGPRRRRRSRSSTRPARASGSRARTRRPPRPDRRDESARSWASCPTCCSAIPGQAAVMPQLFVPYRSRDAHGARRGAHGRRPAGARARRLRALVRRSTRACRSREFTPLAKLVSRSVARPRFYTSLLTLFAGVGARAGRHRHLRRDELLRRAARARDQHPHGARCTGIRWCGW
jgi:hypothetical protein